MECRAPDCATLAPRALGSAANAISHMKPHSAARTLAGGYSSQLLHDVDKLFPSPVTYAIVCASRRGQAMP